MYAVDPRTLRVILGTTSDSAPRLFADSALSLDAGTAAGHELLIPLTGSGKPTVLQLSPASDPRDALDHGADLVITRDPAVVRYVAGRPEFVTFPLPWSRTYVLLQPAGTELLSGALSVDSMASSLASDVVPAEARAAEGPFWWNQQEACGREVSPLEPTPKIPRILYPRADLVAKALAERIVALAVGTGLRAAGSSDADLAAALRDQTNIGYVIDVPRQVAAPCYRSRGLPDGAALQPLIDTRARAIVRRGAPSLVVDWDGSVRLGDVAEESRGSP